MLPFVVKGVQVFRILRIIRVVCVIRYVQVVRRCFQCWIVVHLGMDTLQQLRHGQLHQLCLQQLLLCDRLRLLQQLLLFLYLYLFLRHDYL